jgi:hypothetical protein
MVWLITITVIFGIIFAAHAYAKGFGMSAYGDRPSSHPTIFLEARPPATWKPIEGKKPFLVSEGKLQLPRIDSDIKEVTRHGLPTGTFEPSGYGLYSYLLFGSSSQAGRTKRYAAAQAYCTNFLPISEAEKQGIPRLNLNVFSVPIKDTAPSTYCDNARKLVDDYYDYLLAKKLFQDAGLEGDGIYLVACNKPILAGCDRKKMLVVQLTTVPEDLSELCVLEFRRQTRKPNYWNDTTLRNVALTLRTQLPRIAQFISFAGVALAR